ncbi:MAG: hypothetical protein EBU88_17590, partial [Acidobacteria bacterium]|nr:hypothetical protein [Acidobacteriota bacterium]
NLEAAEEVARQVRIRDLSGLIVIDFIDMSDVRHNIAVEKRLKESLAMDRARIQVGRISQFGLLEMSRQRLRSSILEANSSRCPHCSGSGLIRSKESLSAQLLRVLDELITSYPENNGPIIVSLESSLAFFLLSHKRAALESLEKRREKFFVLNGRRYSHIMDPRTGHPVESVLSVAVISQTGTDGDALDNAFFVLGPGRTRALKRRYPVREVIFFLPHPTKRWVKVQR